jgi:hypothetical protein
MTYLKNVSLSQGDLTQNFKNLESFVPLIFFY